MKSIKSHNYRMTGLGGLLTIYGGAADTLEEQHQTYKKDFFNAKERYSDAATKSERKELRQRMIHFKNLINETKEKMNMLIKSVESIVKDININIDDIKQKGGSENEINPKNETEDTEETNDSENTNRKYTD